jgi:hypothetical protein
VSSTDEARELARLFDGKTVELAQLLSSQLAVLKAQAQMYVGLGGVCITVTGFSGHNMVNAGRLSAGAMILGILLILVAIVITLRTLSSVHWVTQDLGGSAEDLARRVIARRDAQHRSLSIAGAFIGTGLLFYLAAVLLAALARAHWTAP